MPKYSGLLTVFIKLWKVSLHSFFIKYNYPFAFWKEIDIEIQHFGNVWSDCKLFRVHYQKFKNIEAICGSYEHSWILIKLKKCYYDNYLEKLLRKYFPCWKEPANRKLNFFWFFFFKLPYKILKIIFYKKSENLYQ